MFDSIELLRLINDIVQATIVIFGAGAVLYNLKYSRNDDVVRAYSLLLTFVSLVYFADLLITRTDLPISAEPWLRLQWVGIAFVPSAQFHLSNELLKTTGLPSRRRSWAVPIGYASSAIFLLLVLFTNLIVSDVVDLARAPHLAAGPFFAAFTIFFWVVTSFSVFTAWRAYQRCITTVTRERMRRVVLAFLAAPIGVFPYLLANTNPDLQLPVMFWLLLIAGNLIIGSLFFLLTTGLVYFGASSPDRVVRVRLYKFMARGPLAASILLLVYVLTNRVGSFFGLPTSTLSAVAIVLTALVVQTAIHSLKTTLERIFQLNQEPDVRRIQALSDRLLTEHDLQQFLEIVLTVVCERLRSPAAFVVSTLGERQKLEAIVGRHALGNLDDHLGQLPQPETVSAENDGLISWQNYWIKPLYNRHNDTLLGVLGVHHRVNSTTNPILNADGRDILTTLARQAAYALEDRFLQQGVFAAVEGLLPEISALQTRRGAAAYRGQVVLESETPDLPDAPILDDPQYSAMVRDAIKHYWGGPKLSESPLLDLEVVQAQTEEVNGNRSRALQQVLRDAIERQKPEGERSMTRAEWILYNILDLRVIQGRQVRDVARRLAMSESDLYRKQRVAIEAVAEAIADMERERLQHQAAELPTAAD